MENFQTNTQLRMLQVHAMLVKAATYLYTPVRNMMESFGNTNALREKARTLKVIK